MIRADDATMAPTAVPPGARATAALWSPGRIRVAAPARLHLGFLDPAATLGRRFGSVGLTVEGLETVVEIGRASRDAFDAFEGGGAALARAVEHLHVLRDATRCHEPVHLALRRAPPMHAGLGSGTQLALATGRAFCGLFNLGLESTAIAALLGRGVRSGVGIAAFDHGGLLLDGGPRADGSAAALLARIAMPSTWRVILARDPRVQGLSGAGEKAALATLAPLPHAVSAEICHEVLMRLLPGAAAAEFEPFAAGVSHVQRLLGDHFAAAQEGRRFTSAAVGTLVDWIGANVPAGIGQSSWGSVGFAVVRSAEAARSVLAAAREAAVVDPALGVSVTAPRNRGATVAVLRAGDAAAAADLCG
ncbi:MAG: beta-ribofuranosylaminobenzene 5'-phosphate synthase family protein [Betaproteobacteria bacterium]